MNHSNQPLLLCLIILGIWTMIVWAWMYWTRIPAVLKSKMKLDANAPRGAQMNTLPPQIRWKADNYNHLLEQPTLFYATIVCLVLLSDTSDYTLWLAWSYVVIRIIHSLVQATINNITLRFFLFFISSLILIGLLSRAAIIFYI